MHAMGFSIFALTFNACDRFYAPRRGRRSFVLTFSHEERRGPYAAPEYLIRRGA